MLLGFVLNFAALQKVWQEDSIVPRPMTTFFLRTRRREKRRSVAAQTLKSTSPALSCNCCIHRCSRRCHNDDTATGAVFTRAYLPAELQSPAVHQHQTTMGDAQSTVFPAHVLHDRSYFQPTAVDTIRIGLLNKVCVCVWWKGEGLHLYSSDKKNEYKEFPFPPVCNTK